jgi:hypothetical protein
MLLNTHYVYICNKIYKFRKNQNRLSRLYNFLKERVHFSSFKYYKSVTFIPHILFSANQYLNYLKWCIYHLIII